MMELMVLMIRKHTAIIPTVVDSDNPVDEKIHDFIQEKLNAWSQAEYTHIGLVSEVNAEEAKVWKNYIAKYQRKEANINALFETKYT